MAPYPQVVDYASIAGAAVDTCHLVCYNVLDTVIAGLASADNSQLLLYLERRPALVCLPRKECEQ
jgi:hypothetical protein